MPAACTNAGADSRIAPAEGAAEMVTIAALTGFLSFLLAYLVISPDTASRPRQAFVLMAVFLGTWAVIAVFTLSKIELDSFRRPFLVGCLFQLLHFGAFLHFALALTEKTPRRYRLVYLIYLPCLVSTALFWLHNDYVSEFALVDGTWRLNHLYGSAAFLSMLVIWFTYYVAAAVVYFNRAPASATVRERRVFRILGASVVILMVITFTEVVIVPLLFGVPSRAGVFLFKLFWLLCFGYLVDRFHFLTAPPRLEEIALTAFPGYVVVILDNRRAVYCVNEEASNLFEVPSKSLQGAALGELFEGGAQLCDLIDSDSDGTGSVSVVLELRNHGSSNRHLDVKASALRDSAGNRIGYVFYGRRVFGTRRSELIAEITPREVEIIEQILSGHTNAAIADRLCISERTVKTHITHIFDKLGVENRIQLYGILKDNHFISRHTADRHLVRIPGQRRNDNPFYLRD